MYEQIAIEKIVPNTWNPNVMPSEVMAKLAEGMQRTLKVAGKLPPIVVRKHPDTKGLFQIIDGFHRWSVLKKMKQTVVDAFVLEVPDDLARVLTATLNYIKGEADPNKYPMLVVEALQANPDLDLEDLAKLLPENEDMLQDLIFASEAATAALNAVMDARPDTENDSDSRDAEPERWVNLNFAVPLEVASLVEAEIDRISERLAGKNRRMRALEFMSVMSSQTPLEDVDEFIKKKEPKPEEAQDAGFTSDVIPTKADRQGKKSGRPAPPPPELMKEGRFQKSKKPISAPKKRAKK
jgi:ParB-like chromosome segregation protein Spo0J